MGITEEQVAVIGSDAYMDSPLLSPREKAAVLWAEHVTKNTAKHRDDIAEEVQKHFSEQEFVELTFVSSYFNMRNRYHDSLKLPTDDAKTVGDVMRLRPDPNGLKAYLQEVLDNWPDAFPEPKE
ncbi:MAG: hypothetical protein V3U53_02725 [bacterium]